VKYELGVYIPEDDILHSHRRENLKPYKVMNFHVHVTDSQEGAGSIQSVNLLFMQEQ
jgi:N-acetyl-gamma-glutamylphosphate reductase